VAESETSRAQARVAADKNLEVFLRFITINTVVEHCGIIGDAAGAVWANLYGGLVVLGVLVVTLPALKIVTGSVNPVETAQARAT
jgi:hypothetical protein